MADSSSQFLKPVEGLLYLRHALEVHSKTGGYQSSPTTALTKWQKAAAILRCHPKSENWEHTQHSSSDSSRVSCPHPHWSFSLVEMLGLPSQQWFLGWPVSTEVDTTWPEVSFVFLSFSSTMCLLITLINLLIKWQGVGIIIVFPLWQILIVENKSHGSEWKKHRSEQQQQKDSDSLSVIMSYQNFHALS